MARPPIYTDKTKVTVDATGTKSRLNQGTERRAIINHLIDVGGTATLKQIDDHFGYDIRSKVFALVRAGWLVTDAGEEK